MKIFNKNFLTKNALQPTYPSLDNKEKNIIGVFRLITVETKKQPKSCFLYLDLRKSSIEYYSLYVGKSIYKEFGKFCSSTISDIYNSETAESLNNKPIILIPKKFLSKSLYETSTNIYRISLATYTMKSFRNTPLSEASNIVTLSLTTTFYEDRLKLAVKNFNEQFNTNKPKDMIKVRVNPKDFPYKTKINSRHYSTYRGSFTSVKEFDKKYKPSATESKRFKGWKYYTINTEKTVISIPMIRQFTNSYWSYIKREEIRDDLESKISSTLMIQREDGTMRSISRSTISDVNDLGVVKNLFIEWWADKPKYHTETITKLIIFFNIRPKEYPKKLWAPEDLRNKPKHTKKRYTLPATANIEEWGKCKFNHDKTFVNIKLYNSTNTADVMISDNTNAVTIYSSEGDKKFSFIDYKTNSNNLSTFTRVFNTETLYFEDGKIKFTKIQKDCKFIEPIKEQKLSKEDKLITMDLETRAIDGKMDPVTISWYDGKKKKEIHKSFSIWEYGNYEEMLKKAFESIMIRKYYGYKVYFHNFSYFDGIFILKTLANMDVKIDIKIRDSRILSLCVKYDKTSNKPEKYKGSFTIMDSLLVLPSSLNKLCEDFECENKDLFPLKILNKYLDGNYIGDVPEIKDFYVPNPYKNLKDYKKFIKDYNKYKASFVSSKKKWSLKENLMKYCVQDCKSLYQLLIKFSKEIESKFKINIFKYPTLPSIAFAIYRSKYLKKEHQIPIIIGEMYDDIAQAYYGGFVDVYKPYGRNIERYDVNSLYPKSMRDMALPTGKPIYFEGNPRSSPSRISESELFGFVYVTVNCPEYLDKPILPFKTKINGASTTIYPTGIWSGWYFTEEMKNAEMYGYTFVIHKGYLFQKRYIFREYVDDLYKMKADNAPSKWSLANPIESRGSPVKYFIAKILLNSLYGRFGMNPEVEKHKILSPQEYDEMDLDPNIEVVDFKILEDKVLTSFKSHKSDGRADEIESINISVPIAAAITAWSRVNMTYYIMKYNNDLLYIDTDGLKSLRKFDEWEVDDKELGKMKHEGSYKEAVFLAPKVYGGIKNNKEDIKVKGLKKNIYLSYWKLKSLLYIDSIKIEQEKWKRSFEEGTIKILEEIYTLSATENKRILIRNSWGEIVRTKPYRVVVNGEIIEPEKEVLYYLPIIPEIIPVLPELSEKSKDKICKTGSLAVIQPSITSAKISPPAPPASSNGDRNFQTPWENSEIERISITPSDYPTTIQHSFSRCPLGQWAKAENNMYEEQCCDEPKIKPFIDSEDKGLSQETCKPVSDRSSFSERKFFSSFQIQHGKSWKLRQALCGVWALCVKEITGMVKELGWKIVLNTVGIPMILSICYLIPDEYINALDLESQTEDVISTNELSSTTYHTLTIVALSMFAVNLLWLLWNKSGAEPIPSTIVEEINNPELVNLATRAVQEVVRQTRRADRLERAYWEYRDHVEQISRLTDGSIEEILHLIWSE